MAIDHRIGNKVMKSQRREDAPGTRVDPHPYIGIVKNNLDPTRCGRLQVWIPDLGGKDDDPKNWRTVNYASPFMGTTNPTKGAASAPNKENKFGNTPNTYGMWMVPPDIGVEVLVLFVAGDPLRGYWFACVNSSIGRYMIPGVASSNNFTLEGASDDVKQTLQSGGIAPVAEFNENDPAVNQKPSPYLNPKPVHEPQYRILKEQGLDRDTSRGVITSSSQRESPSQVFGISTPGRPYPDKGADNPEAYLNKVRAGTLTEDDYSYTARKGGHTFIMDDGNLIGKDQLVRLRTAGGHQIMMNDSANTLYISHADGTSWIELTNTGEVNIYTSDGFNVRTGGAINLHADSNININSGRNINIKAQNTIQVESVNTNLLQTNLNVESLAKTEFKAGAGFNVDASSQLSLNAGGILSLNGSSILQNSGNAKAVKSLSPLKVNSLPDTFRANPTSLWISKSNSLQSIVTAAPTHEPYPRSGAARLVETQLNPTPLVGIQPQAAYTGTNDTTKNLAGSKVFLPAGSKAIRNQPPAKNTIGNLSKDQVTALMAQIGNSESGGNYAENSKGNSYIGKYQMGYGALMKLGYVKSSVTSNAQLNNPNSWTGKDGIDSKSAFLNNGPVQEEAMEALLKDNHSIMISNGTITAADSPETVGGILMVAHLLGPNEGTPDRPGAAGWRKGKGGADANKTTGDQYFQTGKFAILVLAPQVPTIQQG